MITLAAVLARLPALDEPRLRLWIAEDWVRPAHRGDEWLFADIDLARLTLILDLHAMNVGGEAIPVVLSLLDQLHEQRRHLHRVAAALDRAGVSPASLLSR